MFTYSINLLFLLSCVYIYDSDCASYEVVRLVHCTWVKSQRKQMRVLSLTRVLTIVREKKISPFSSGSCSYVVYFWLLIKQQHCPWKKWCYHCHLQVFNLYSKAVAIFLPGFPTAKVSGLSRSSRKSHMFVHGLKSTQINEIISTKWVGISVSSYLTFIFNYVALIINNIIHWKAFVSHQWKKNPFFLFLLYSGTRKSVQLNT